MSEFITPSAFSALEIPLERFLNLDEFPIHDLTSSRRAELVEQCRQGLDKWGCAHVPDFILPSAIEEMHQEALRLIDKGYAREAHAWVNPFLTKEDTSLDKDHPKRFFEERTSSFINSDLLEGCSVLRMIYDSDVMVHFVAECLNVGPIYRWAEPLGRNPYSVMKDGDYFPWHFDGNDFTVSILVNEADGGGDFEYVPDIRTPHNECFDDIGAVLHGERKRVRVLSLNTGDLQIFKGRYSMHRVTKTKGSEPRIIALPTYVTNPYLVNRPHHSEAFYGRSMDIHHERNLGRLDKLTD
ncbi:MAG TPA: hypothetical protein EYQ52_00370 [Candidatus Thioglobus sp.]|nr:hypothetical protein [Candidatus Thioglobus sp.]